VPETGGVPLEDMDAVFGAHADAGVAVRDAGVRREVRGAAATGCARWGGVDAAGAADRGGAGVVGRRAEARERRVRTMVVRPMNPTLLAIIQSLIIRAQRSILAASASRMAKTLSPPPPCCAGRVQLGSLTGASGQVWTCREPGE
jgi:hypothetical protein